MTLGPRFRGDERKRVSWDAHESKETHQTVVRLAPPLVIARADLDWALDRFEEVLRELDGTRRRARAA